MFYYYWGKENLSLYRGLRYIEFRYNEVSLFCSHPTILRSLWDTYDTGKIQKRAVLHSAHPNKLKLGHNYLK